MACRRESGFKDTKFWWIMGGFSRFYSRLRAISFQPFCPCHPSVGLSSHVMPTPASAMAGIYGCGFVAFVRQ